MAVGEENKKIQPVTLQPALPMASAIALPIPLEAPVTMTTGASTFLATSALDCSTAATWGLIPICTIIKSEQSSFQNQMGLENTSKSL